jgi:hypothetical protein
VDPHGSRALTAADSCVEGTEDRCTDCDAGTPDDGCGAGGLHAAANTIVIQESTVIDLRAAIYPR